MWPAHLDEPIARGLRTGDPIPGTGGLLTMGPLKVISDGSLNTRTAYCHDPYPGLAGTAHPCGMLLVPPEELRPLLRRATAAGLDCAVHAIGDPANTLALDAFAATGARGRDRARAAARPGRPRPVRRSSGWWPASSRGTRSTTGTSPTATGPAAPHRAFAYRSLLDAGARAGPGLGRAGRPAGPVGHPRRRRASQRRRAPELASRAGDPAGGGAGRVAPGRPVRSPSAGAADLVITELDPAAASPARLRAMPVAGTLLAGRWTHRAGI